ncbi:MAG: type II toxin-antitoxin system Phd/YefM family antitoxin [Pseudomonadota bacterium]|nr:type II toxin-antitoxin system Phd/YefM family antitoxin [Pseudomonadota bacterium]
MRTVQIKEAETSFSALLNAVEAGEEVAITRYGRLVARMIPGARRSALPPPLSRGSDSRMALEAPAVMEAGLLAPLD